MTIVYMYLNNYVFQKRRQKENQPPGNLKPEDLDKELLHALKAANNLQLWENIKVGVLQIINIFTVVV